MNPKKKFFFWQQRASAETLSPPKLVPQNWACRHPYPRQLSLLQTGITSLGPIYRLAGFETMGLIPIWGVGLYLPWGWVKTPLRPSSAFYRLNLRDTPYGNNTMPCYYSIRSGNTTYEEQLIEIVVRAWYASGMITVCQRGRLHVGLDVASEE